MAVPRRLSLDLSNCRTAVSHGWRSLGRWFGKYPRARAALRAIKRVLRPVTSLRQQGRDSVYRHLCRTFRQDPVVAVPEFEGEFSLDVRSDVLKRLLMDGHYEPHLAACCKRALLPDRDAIDVGANVGFYSVLLARNLSPGRRVLAVEPIPEAVAQLRGNLQRNRVVQRVLIHDGAVSDTDGPCALTTVEGKSEYSTIGPLVHPSVCAAPGRTVHVHGVRLDRLVRQFALDPGFIKIDVEGAELEVLRGAAGLLDGRRPTLLIEIHRLLLEKRGGSADAVLEFLKGSRYQLLNPENRRRPPVWRGCFSILCLPEERELRSWP